MKTDQLKASLRYLLVTIVAGLLAACTAEQEVEEATQAANTDYLSEPIVVYSSRKQHLIEPVFEQFTLQTGITVEYTTDKAGVLIERIKTEGQNTPADLLITVDAGNLGYAAAEGIFQAINSAVINDTVAPHLRDEQDLWTGLALRARTILYSTERVKAEDLSTYQALGESQWQGRLCLKK